MRATWNFSAPPKPTDGQLDGARRVLEHRHAHGDGAQRRTARLAQLQRAVDIAVHEHALDGNFRRRVLGQQRLQALEDQPQSRGGASPATFRQPCARATS